MLTKILKRVTHIIGVLVLFAGQHGNRGGRSLVVGQGSQTLC